MDKAVKVFLCAVLTIGMVGCSSGEAKQQETSSASSIAKQDDRKEETAVNEEDTVEDASWDELESLGMIETENGLFYVSITLPKDLVGENVTQESIDQAAGDTYTSGKVNEDGSVTYRMTKKQHKAMLDGITKSIDDALQEMAASGDMAVSEVTHNKDFTSFDVKLTTEEIGLAEGFMVMALYMYGGMYSIFTGKRSNITVNYYSASGKLIETANSADLGE